MAPFKNKMKKTKTKTTISSRIVAFSLVILSAAGVYWLVTLFFGNKNELPVLGEPGHRAGSFSFINQDGKQITEKTVANKVTVAEYFFTSCPSICPRMNRNLQDVYEKFRQNPDFMILSHTVDPGKDSVSVLKAYAAQYDATAPGWQFLTGDKNALYTNAVRDYLLSAADSGTDQFIHTQYVALLDRSGRIRGFYDMTSKENVSRMESSIQQLLSEQPN
jgi:protein SCO1/2